MATSTAMLTVHHEDLGDHPSATNRDIVITGSPSAQATAAGASLGLVVLRPVCSGPVVSHVVLPRSMRRGRS